MTGRLSVSPDALSRELDGEVLVLDLRTSLYFGMTGTAARIWRLVEGGSDRDAIVDALAREYGEPAGGIGADVGQVLADLLARGLGARPAAARCSPPAHCSGFWRAPPRCGPQALSAPRGAGCTRAVPSAATRRARGS